MLLRFNESCIAADHLYHYQKFYFFNSDMICFLFELFHQRNSVICQIIGKTRILTTHYMDAIIM